MTNKIYHYTNHHCLEPNPNYDYNRIAYGLGFYFSNSKDDASHYGKNIFELDMRKLCILKKEGRGFNREEIMHWLLTLKRIAPHYYENAWTSWNENEQLGRFAVIDSIIEQAGDNPVEQILAFQSEIFIRDTEIWNRIAKSIGIHGIEIKDPYKTGDKELAHYIIYDRLA